jgi:hypothetical protein
MAFSLFKSLKGQASRGNEPRVPRAASTLKEVTKREDQGQQTACEGEMRVSGHSGTRGLKKAGGGSRWAWRRAGDQDLQPQDQDRRRVEKEADHT